MSLLLWSCLPLLVNTATAASGLACDGIVALAPPCRGGVLPAKSAACCRRPAATSDRADSAVAAAKLALADSPESPPHAPAAAVGPGVGRCDGRGDCDGRGRSDGCGDCGDCGGSAYACACAGCRPSGYAFIRAID